MTEMTAINATTITAPGFYKWDGVKRTRKKAFTHYLTYYIKDYSNCPRKYKKRYKSGAINSVYYDKWRIYIFNPKMLSMPIPKDIFRMFSFNRLPINSGQICRFRRYSEVT